MKYFVKSEKDRNDTSMLPSIITIITSLPSSVSLSLSLHPLNHHHHHHQQQQQHNHNFNLSFISPLIISRLSTLVVWKVSCSLLSPFFLVQWIPSSVLIVRYFLVLSWKYKSPLWASYLWQPSRINVLNPTSYIYK